MELSPPANTDIATLQALERTEERLGADIAANRKDLERTEERLNARIDRAVAASVATMTKAMHAAELRTTGVIVLAFLGTNLLG